MKFRILIVKDFFFKVLLKIDRGGLEHHLVNVLCTNQSSTSPSNELLSYNCFRNEGSPCFAAVLNEYGIRASASKLYHLARKGQNANLHAGACIIQTQRRRRRQLKVRSHTAETSRQRREKSASKYSSGRFGNELVPIATSSVFKDPDSGDESDTTCSKGEQRNCPIGRRKKVQDWIGCDLCDRWFHGNCVGVKKVSDFSYTPYFCEDCEDSS